MAVATLTKNDNEQSIDRVNQWMRSQPWYQRQLAAWGQSPSNVRLSKFQSEQLVRLAQANGVQIDEGHFEVDPGGNFNPRGHKMRNTLIGLGAGAAVAAPFVLPAVLGGGGAAAGGSAAAQALVPSTLTGFTTPGVGMAATTTGLAGGAGVAGGAATAGGGNFITRAIRSVADKATGSDGGGTDWMRTLAPLLGLGATAATGGFSTPSSGMDPALQKQIEELIAGQTARGKQSDPIYAAAMQLAGNLAPTSQNNPRLQEAIRDAGSPLPQRQMDPQVAEAYARLMGRR